MSTGCLQDDDDGMSEGDEEDEEDEEPPPRMLVRPLPYHNPRTGAAALLLSVVPSVVPRASWPCAEAAVRPQVTFSSEPKLEQVGGEAGAGEEAQHNSAAALLRRFLHLNRFWRTGKSKQQAHHRSAVAAALRMHVNYVTGRIEPHRKSLPNNMLIAYVHNAN